MYKNLKLEKSYKINSCYHDLTPWVKILCFIMFSVITLIQSDIVFLGIISILLLCLILMSDVDLKMFLIVLNKLKLLLLIVFLFNLLIRVDLVSNISIVLKVLLIAMYYSLIIFTTNFDSINYGFNIILTPFKFLGNIVNKISLFITSVFMFIPNMIVSRGDILDALSLKGLDFKSSNILGKLKIIGIVIKKSFVTTFINSSDKKKAIDVRMNDRSKFYSQKKFGLGDIFILFTHVFVIAVVIIKGVIL